MTTTRRSLEAFSDLLFDSMKLDDGDLLTLWRNVYDRLIALGWDDVAEQLISTLRPLGQPAEKPTQVVDKTKHGNYPLGNGVSR
jgi:hypothetical protein